MANLLLVLIILLAASCKSTEAAESILVSAAEINKEEAALLYMGEYEKNEDVRLLYNAAYSYIEAGNYEEALSLLNEGIEKYPDYIRFPRAKAYVLNTIGDKDNYLNTLAALNERVPGDIEIAELYATALYENGDTEKAIELSKDILRRSSTNSVALGILSKHYDFYKIYLKDEKPQADAPAEESPEASEEPFEENPEAAIEAIENSEAPIEISEPEETLPEIEEPVATEDPSSNINIHTGGSTD